MRVDFLLTNPLLIEQFAPVVEELVRRGHRARLVLPDPKRPGLAASVEEENRILEACRAALGRAGIPPQAPDLRADVVVTVISHRQVRKWKGLKFKFRYGIGLLRDGFHYRPGRVTRFDGLMVHGDFEVPIFSEWIDPSRIRTMGMPRHDMALKQGPDRKQARERLGLALDDSRPVVAFLPTWDEHSGTARFAGALTSIADRYRILVKPHALTEVRASEIGNQRMLDRLPAQRVPSDHPLVDVVRAADVVVADAKSGVGPEAALLAPDVPLVLTSNLPAEAYFEQVASLGILVTEPRDLAPAIANAREGDSLATSRRRLAELFFAERSGAAAARAADALLDLVDSSSLSHRLRRAFRVRARRWLGASPSASANEQAAEFWGKAQATTIAGGDYYENTRQALEEDVYPLLRPEHRVVDFGCGDATYTLPMAKTVAQVDAIDISTALIAKARSRAAALGLDNITFSVASELPEDRVEHYDVVCAMGVLVCLIDDGGFTTTLDRLGRSVRPGGYLLLRETVSGLGRVVWRRDDYVACYRPRRATLDPLVDLGFELVVDRQLAIWSAKKQRSNYLWLLHRSS